MKSTFQITRGGIYVRRWLMVVMVLLALTVAGCTNLILPRGKATVQGVVTVYGEEPDGIEVYVRAAGTRFESKVDAKGTFKIELPAPANFTIETTGVGIAATSVPVTLKKGDAISGIELDTVFLPPTPHVFDFSDPVALRLIEIPWDGWDFQAQQDPIGNTSMYFPPGSNAQRPPVGYSSVKYALLKYPDVDSFEISWQTIGELNAANPANGNRSQNVIFGYQDMDNWYMVALQDDANSRVSRVSNGSHKALCTTTNANLWSRDNHQYQEVRTTVVTEGSNKVVRTFVDGVELDDITCEIPLSDYQPGRVGFGTLSFSSGHWAYFNDVTIDILD